MLGNGGVIHVGGEEEGDAELGAGLEVDLVEAKAVFGQIFSFGSACSKIFRVMRSLPQMSPTPPPRDESRVGSAEWRGALRRCCSG